MSCAFCLTYLVSVATRIVHYHIKSLIVLNITNIEGLYVKEFCRILRKPRDK